MKKFNLITFAVILMLLPILQSCLDDANNDEWVTCPPGGILAIGTMKIPKESSLAICRWEKRSPDMRTVKYSR